MVGRQEGGQAGVNGYNPRNLGQGHDLLQSSTAQCPFKSRLAYSKVRN